MKPIIMAGKRKKGGQAEGNIFKRCIITLISIMIIIFILNIAPNYIRNEITDKTNLVINNSNVTKSLKADLIVEKDVVYLSKADVENFFDGNIYYDSQYNQIVTTSDTKVAILPIDSNKVTINGSNVTIYAPAIQRDGKYYLPLSEISKSVYNVETTYIESTNIVTMVSLDRELVYANSSKNNSIKYKPTIFSKTVDKVERGDNLTVVKTEEVESGWKKVTTENGKIGYVKANTLVNEQKVRDEFTLDKQIDGKVSIVWDYFSEYATAPSRTGKIEGINVVSPSFITLKKLGQGELEENIGNAGIKYINWAHENEYKVWVMVSNNSMKETTSEILNDYKLREKFINNIMDVVVEYDLDGVNLDFENMYEADKDEFSKLVIELAPRLRELGKVLSVDVTAPDGSPDWSLCFDRNVIGKIADYIVFMAYDQNGISSTEPGTTAGYDWVETNINKFINQAEVDSEKIILGIPFYTRIWKTTGDKVTSEVVNLKDTYAKIPRDATVTWLDDLRQNYAEYVKNNTTYKIWIEDSESIKEKVSLVNKYNLAGTAAWEKDRETNEIWDIIAEQLNI